MQILFPLKKSFSVIIYMVILAFISGVGISSCSATHNESMKKLQTDMDASLKKGIKKEQEKSEEDAKKQAEESASDLKKKAEEKASSY